MQVFHLETEKFEHDYYLNALTIHEKNKGIIYNYSGVASAQNQFEEIKKFLEKKSKELKLDLTTQICINVYLNDDSTYKGYTIIYVSNPSAYCLLLGLNAGGQRVLLEKIDKEAHEVAFKELEKELLKRRPEYLNLAYISKLAKQPYVSRFDVFKPKKIKSVNKLMNQRDEKRYLSFEDISQYVKSNTDTEINSMLKQMWYHESEDRLKILVELACLKEHRHLQDFIDLFEERYQKYIDDAPDDYKTPKYYEAYYSYKYTAQDSNNLGSYEKKKPAIVKNLGKMTMIEPTVLESSTYTCLHTQNGTNSFPAEFFINLMRPFKVTLSINEKECVINFSTARDCFLANLLFRSVNVDGYIMFFKPKEQYTSAPRKVHFK